MTDNQIAVRQERTDNLPISSVYGSMQSFEDAQRMAKALAASNLVPSDYQGNTANTLIALEMSHRTGSSPMAVMQNLHIIEGRPSWSSQFVIAALNSCGRFSPLRYRVQDLGQRQANVDEWQGPKGQRTKVTRAVTIHDKECVAWAYDKNTGDVLEGPPVSIGMAVAEGWYGKSGSKWVTMPDLMLRYRAAKFFGNLYAPDVLMGMSAADEVEDFIEHEPVRSPRDIPAHANDNEPAPRKATLNDFVASQPAGKSQAAHAQEVIEAEVVDPAPQTAAANPRRSRKPKPDPEPVVEDAQYADYPEADGSMDDIAQEPAQQAAAPSGGDLF